MKMFLIFSWKRILLIYVFRLGGIFCFSAAVLPKEITPHVCHHFGCRHCVLGLRVRHRVVERAPAAGLGCARPPSAEDKCSLTWSFVPFPGSSSSPLSCMGSAGSDQHHPAPAKASGLQPIFFFHRHFPLGSSSLNLFFCLRTPMHPNPGSSSTLFAARPDLP